MEEQAATQVRCSLYFVISIVLSRSRLNMFPFLIIPLSAYLSPLCLPTPDHPSICLLVTPLSAYLYLFTIFCCCLCLPTCICSLFVVVVVLIML